MMIVGISILSLHYCRVFILYNSRVQDASMQDIHGKP